MSVVSQLEPSCSRRLFHPLLQISQGWIVWQHRTRLQVTLVHPQLLQLGVQAALESLPSAPFAISPTSPTTTCDTSSDRLIYTLPHFALNDVHLGERDQCRPIAYELEIDHRREMQRSSGVLICTGTGSSAWMYNAAAIGYEQVNAVLTQAQAITGGVKPSMHDIRDLTDRLNHQNLFHWSSSQMMVRLSLFFFSLSPFFAEASLFIFQYYAREPIGGAALHHRHGVTDRVIVRPFGYDCILNIDGTANYPVAKGWSVVLTIGAEPGANLSALSLAGTGGEPFSKQ